VTEDRSGRRSLTARLLSTAMVASARVNTAIQRASSAWANATGAALASALTDDELSAITVALYDRSHTAGWADFGLRGWEEDWYAVALPPPPATVLVCAAGGGREVRALVTMGYAVDAFEPADAAFAQLRQAEGPRCRTIQASYEDFVTGNIALADTYDAVVLGWGSLSHVMSAPVRRVIWKAADRHCTGPLLASFYMRHRHRVGRAERWGRLIGEPLGRLRGVPRRGGAVKYAHWGGFSEPLTFEEVEQAGRDLGRPTRWGLRGAWPYVTLEPRSEGRPEE